MINHIIFSYKGWNTRSVTCHNIKLWECLDEISRRWGKEHKCFSSSTVKKTFFIQHCTKRKIVTCLSSEKCTRKLKLPLFLRITHLYKICKLHTRYGGADDFATYCSGIWNNGRNLNVWSTGGFWSFNFGGDAGGEERSIISPRFRLLGRELLAALVVHTFVVTTVAFEGTTLGAAGMAGFGIAFGDCAKMLSIRCEVLLYVTDADLLGVVLALLTDVFPGFLENENNQLELNFLRLKMKIYRENVRLGGIRSCVCGCFCIRRWIRYRRCRSRDLLVKT